MTKEQAKSIGDKKIFDILKAYTNMTDSDIRRHISQGVSVYENTQDGYEDYKSECIAGLCDEEDILGMWNALEVVGGFRIDYCI